MDQNPVEYANQYLQESSWRMQNCKQRLKNERTQILKSLCWLLLLAWGSAVSGFNWLFGLGFGLWGGIILLQLFMIFGEIKLLLLIYKHNNLILALRDQYISKERNMTDITHVTRDDVPRAELYASAEVGAKFLDGVDPQWFTKIDIGRLNLGSCDDCVLGQLYGEQYGPYTDEDETGFEIGMNTLFPDTEFFEMEDKVVTNGFDIPALKAGESATNHYQALTEGWKFQILSRSAQ